MSDINGILNNLLYFVIFVVIILIIALLILKTYLKKYSFTSKKSKLYGILYNLDINGVISLSLISVEYLFLVWSAMKTVSINLLYATIIVALPLLSNIINKDYFKIIPGVIISLINVFAIHIIHFVHIYLIGEVSDIFMRISVFFIVAFAFVYFTYNYINDINDIVKNNKGTRKAGESRAD